MGSMDSASNTLTTTTFPEFVYDLDTGIHQTKSIGTVLPHFQDKNVPKLFEPVTIRGNVFQNRIMVSPMCMYSCEKQDGILTDFHLAHYGNLSLRGPSLVMIEASAVEPRGRLSPQDAGIWSDAHGSALKRVVRLVKASGSKLGIQLAHGGRKSATWPPYHNYEENEGRTGRGIVPTDQGGFFEEIVAPSPIPWKDDGVYPVPHELTIEEIQGIVQKFVDAAKRSADAGVDVIEIHAAHGYLIHEFLSGNSNKRTDKYGGSLQNRLRFLLEIIRGIRSVIPPTMPLFCRVSGTDYAITNEGGDNILTADPNGWDIYQVIELCRQAVPLGLDLIDISSGGNISTVTKGIYAPGFGFQVPLAEQVKLANIPGLIVATVGGMHDPIFSEEVIASGKADMIFIAREFIKNPSWVYTAAEALGVKARWANQYSWMWPLK